MTQRNADILPEHARHPGWVADGCPARITVTSRSRHGFACAANGEHCLPGSGCDDLRRHHARVQRIAALMEGPDEAEA